MTGAAALSLAGCKIDNRPLLARGGPPPMESAALVPYDGPLLELPEAPPAPVAYLPAEQAYVYPERAYRFDRAAYRQAPDYGFAYGGYEPWAWTGDDGMMFAEPIDDGYRYYYYDEGDAYPYYVRDDDYGYAYGDNGVLLAVFTAAGALLGANDYPRYADSAGRYWAHAYDLHEAWRGSPRLNVRETVWVEREPLYWAAQDRWIRTAESYEPWREFRTRHDNGLHRGWYKDRPQPVDYRAIMPGPGAGPAGGRVDDRAWRDGRRHEERRPDVHARESRGPDRGEIRREARSEHRQARHEERRDRGPERQFARAASGAGRDANARGPERGHGGSDRPQRVERREDRGGGGRPMQMAKADHGGGKPDHGGGRAPERGGGPQGGGKHDGGGHGGGGGKPDHGGGGHGGGHGGGDRGGGHGGGKGK